MDAVPINYILCRFLGSTERLLPLLWLKAGGSLSREFAGDEPVMSMSWFCMTTCLNALPDLRFLEDECAIGDETVLYRES